MENRPTLTFVSGIIHGLPLGVAIGAGFIGWMSRDDLRSGVMTSGTLAVLLSLLPAILFDSIITVSRAIRRFKAAAKGWSSL